jgi:4-hydroxy-tetrahydrodipicolinate synthase
MTAAIITTYEASTHEASMNDLSGVIPITATPFDADGRVDEDSIVSLVEFEARCGVHGLNVLGIMGEFHKLTEFERRRVAEVFIKSAAGRFPIVVAGDRTRAPQGSAAPARPDPRRRHAG